MKKTCAAVLAVSMAILWAGGCQEEQASSGDNMARLMALENRGLKTQLQQETKKRDEEIKNLNTQMQTETEKRDDEIKKLAERLAQCEQDRQAMKEKTADEILEQALKISEESVSDFMKEIEEMRAEIDRLNKELAEVKGQK